jgi:hypothetical protein
VKFKKEIMSRPKSEWHSSNKQRTELKKDSKKDLKNIRNKFDMHSGEGAQNSNNRNKKKREQKREEKLREEKLQKGKKSSVFGKDAETDKAAFKK